MYSTRQFATRTWEASTWCTEVDAECSPPSGPTEVRHRDDVTSALGDAGAYADRHAVTFRNRTEPTCRPAPQESKQ